MQYNMQSYAHVLYIRIIYNIIYIEIVEQERPQSTSWCPNVHGNAVLLRMVHFPTSLCPIDLIREWKINHLEHKMFRNANQQTSATSNYWKCQSLQAHLAMVSSREFIGHS